MLQTGEIKSAEDLPETFRKAIVNLVGGLAALQESEDTLTTDKYGSAIVTEGSSREQILHQLRQMLVNGEPDAMKALKPLEQIMHDKVQLEQLRQIEELIANYDFDTALKILDDLSELLTGGKR
jgi:hypothetical protein